jgi:transposase
MSDNNYMDKDAYIKQLVEENAALKKRITMLEKRIEELERLLGMNSKNSSKPPSSDPPGVSLVPPRRRRRKRGARNGHPPHLRELLPPETVKRRMELNPEGCPCGGTNLEKTNQEPLRHQMVDIPPIQPEVVEYIQHLYQCQDCGALVYQPLPEEVKRQHFGPGLLALVAVLTGMLNTSKRKALAVINEVFSVPMSLGGLSNCEAQLVEALEQPYQQTLEHIRAQDIAHADETGWRRGNRQRGWLWALCSAGAAVFMVQAGRGQKAAKKLLGMFSGILVSDRWGGYNFFGGVRQICWAHLKRDFKALSEAGGEIGQIGRELYGLAKQILKMRARVRDGTLQWRTFQHRMAPLMRRVEKLLEAGAAGQGAGRGKCRRIIKHRKHLWTFVHDQRVEPTNNAAERMVRQGVLWRKSSFGTQSERGARYVERILTVCATCRLQGRSVIEYLRHTCRCHLENIAAPSLIKPVGNLAKIA